MELGRKSNKSPFSIGGSHSSRSKAATPFKRNEWEAED